MALRPLNILQWFPTGALARFIEQAELGNWSFALLWLGYSVLFLGLFTTIWMTGLYRLATGQGFLLNIKPKPEKEKEKRPTKQVAGFNGRILGLPEDISMLFVKELRLSWRNPQRRVALLQGLVFPVFMITGLIFSTDMGSFNDLPGFVTLGLAPYAIFAFWATCQNMLAWEGHGLASFLLMPIPRQRIFWGKSFALFLASSVPYLLVGALLIFLVPSWISISAILTGLSLGIVTLAVTAVSSVLFPIRINVEVKQTRSNFQMGGGCRTSLGAIVLTPIVIVILAIPAAAPLGVGVLLNRSWIAIAGLLFSYGYAFILFWYATKTAGTLLLEREPELLEALRQNDE